MPGHRAMRIPIVRTASCLRPGSCRDCHPVLPPGLAPAEGGRSATIWSSAFHRPLPQPGQTGSIRFKRRGSLRQRHSSKRTKHPVGASCAMVRPGRSRMPSRSSGNRRREGAETIRQDPPGCVSLGDLPAHLRTEVIMERSPVKGGVRRGCSSLAASKVSCQAVSSCCWRPAGRTCCRFNLDRATRAGRSRAPHVVKFGPVARCDEFADRRCQLCNGRHPWRSGR